MLHCGWDGPKLIQLHPKQTASYPRERFPFFKKLLPECCTTFPEGRNVREGAAISKIPGLFPSGAFVPLFGFWMLLKGAVLCCSASMLVRSSHVRVVGPAPA